MGENYAPQKIDTYRVCCDSFVLYCILIKLVVKIDILSLPIWVGVEKTPVKWFDLT